MCKEMIKLRQELDRRNIKWFDVSSIIPEQHIDLLISQGIERKYADTTMFRTHFEYGGYKYNVIYGYGSYGGKDAFTGHDGGLLECMTEKVNGGEPIAKMREIKEGWGYIETEVEGLYLNFEQDGDNNA